MIKIKGTEIRSKGTEKKNFEQVEVGLLSNYLKLGLISSNDLTVYLFLLKHDNESHGYAYPSVKYMALETGISERTIKRSTQKLEEVGLIRKAKYGNHPNKNVYFVDLPLSQESLFKQVPELVEEYENRRKKIEGQAAIEKQRLLTHIATVKMDDDQLELEEAERRLLEKLDKLSGGNNGLVNL